jgi:hypothetical protein
MAENWYFLTVIRCLCGTNGIPCGTICGTGKVAVATSQVEETMSQGSGDMPKADKRYLFKREGETWWVKIRVPGTDRTIRKSLKTKNLKEAQARRDKILEQRERLAENQSYAAQLVQLREDYLSGSIGDGEKEIIREKIQEASEDMAQDMGLLSLYRGAEAFDPDRLSEEELRPWKAYKTALGELTPITEVLPSWLETISNKRTRSDYRRGVEVLSERFATIEEIDRKKAKYFLAWAKREKNVVNPTVKKWMSGYKNLWEYVDKDKAVWRDHKLTPDPDRETKKPWTEAHVVEMYRILSERNDKTAGWLKHAIWIAAHTGAREGAIAALEYDAVQKTIRFPKAKKEKDDRIVPAHPAIEANLEAWVSGQRRSASSISNQFTKFKQSLGYGVSQDFHSFRRTLITLLENAGIAENVTADIVGHKKPRISYGLYSSGNEIEVMREAVEKIDYKSKGQKILT